MNKTLFDIYDGDKPYLFISYSHQDEARVFPLIQGIHEAGYRIWMDRGIEVGTEWSNNIANRLNHCEAVLFFVSKNSIQSENCLDEIACAKSHKKTAILVFLEDDVVLPGGVEMQTARFQRLFATRHDGVGSVVAALTDSPLLEPCREEPTPAAEIAPAPAPEATPAPAEAPEKSVFCPRCGAAVSQDSKFCDKCAMPLQSAPAPVVPAPPAPVPVEKPHKLSKKGIILLAIIATVVVGVIVSLLLIVNANRVYTADEVVAAFEEAGYTMEVDLDSFDFSADTDMDFIVETHAYTGRRTQYGMDDQVYFVYVTCTDKDKAQWLYDVLVDMYSATVESDYTGGWYRSECRDSLLGEIVYVSWHDDVVMLTGVDYYDFVLEDADYDEKPHRVLEDVNF